MAPWLMTLAVLVGCGRFSFDRVAADAAPSIDAFVCANPVGHDEDGDSFDDACDACPQVADDQLDTDDDGVGDACDVATTRQQRTFFDPFTGMRSEWMYNASATFGGDSIRLPGVNDSIGIELVGSPGRSVVESGGRVIAGGASGRRQLAIHIGDSSGTANYYCEFYDGTGELLFNLTYTYDEIDYFNNGSVTIGGFIEPASWRIAFVHAPPDLTCIGYWNGVRYEVTGTDPGGIVPETMHISVNNVDTELDYFDRVTTP